VAFIDQNPAWEYTVDSTPDPSYGSADMPDADLGDFFKRPLKIADYDWATTNGNFFESFDPWSLYFQNPRVINRITNFNNLRCKLHVKFVINGNGFHYGRIIAAYKPLPTYDNFTVNRGFFNVDVIGASQKPHIYLDPTTSMGGSMVLPFFYFRNALTIPKSEWNEMGRIDLKAMQQLKHANGATDAVRISVFAWTEDLVLSTPTNTDPLTLVPQGGIVDFADAVKLSMKSKLQCVCCKSNEAVAEPDDSDANSDETLRPQSGFKDEYGGKVSGPATALANIAGALVKVPGIGLYARASQLALSGVANIASLFGYCRPVVDAAIVPYKPVYAGNMANCNVPDSCTKLTTDIKQETTIDPRTVGLGGVDEMNLKSIITRESYLTSFDWNVSTMAGIKLFTTQVTPYMWDVLNLGGSEEIHMTPACHAGMLFQNWRGTMKYRFQVVSSNFHKGRLQIQYDPHESLENEFNVAYNKIIDISEEKDFTVEIGWGTAYPYAEAVNPGTASLPFRLFNFDLPFPDATPSIQNGQLSVWILNDLTVPNSSINNDIQVNVFVSCGDDMEFANPTDEYMQSLVYFPTPPEMAVAEREEKPERREAVEILEPQSGNALIAPDTEETAEPSRPMGEEAMPIMGASIDPTDGLNSICFGEKITSIRALLKRYSLSTAYAAPPGAGHFVYTRTSMNFPLYRGYAPNGIHTAGVIPYNFYKNTVTNHFTPCYEGWRGGLRRKVVSYNNNFRRTGTMSSTRLARPGIAPTEGSNALLTDDNPSYLAGDNLRHFRSGFAGTNIVPIRNNPVLEVEFPYHCPERFIPAKINQPNHGTGLSKHYSNEMQAIATVDNPSGPSFLDYNAVGDDFSLFFYTGVPIMYYAPTDPSA
jgi:hypothetical protein